MSRWPTTNSTYCLSEPIWHWKQDIDNNINDKTKSSSKTKFEKNDSWIGYMPIKQIVKRRKRRFLMTIYEIGRGIYAC